MTTISSSPNGTALDTVSVVGRWLLGALFLYTGFHKALDPVEFLKLVRQYHLSDNYFLLNAIAIHLPWFEVFCGLLLVCGVAVRGTALMLLVMLLPFTLMVLKRALAIHTLQAIPFCAVKFDCGCGMGEVLICRKLAENGMLIVLSAWLFKGSGRQFCFRYGLWR